MPESYTRSQVEAALSEDGYIILQEVSGLTHYHTNLYPGNEIVLDWSRDKLEWEDICLQLEFHDIDCQLIYNRLCGST